MIKKIVALSEKQALMLREMVEWEGAASETEVFRRAINELYRLIKPKGTPEYVQVLKERSERELKSPEDRAKDKVLEAKAKNEFVDEEARKYGMKISEELYDAKIIKESNGVIMCVYATYSMSIPGHVERGEIRIPVEQLTEEAVMNQFEGDRDAIIAIINSSNESTQSETA